MTSLDSDNVDDLIEIETKTLVEKIERLKEEIKKKSLPNRKEWVDTLRGYIEDLEPYLETTDFNVH
jgi:hypothetical protein